MQIIVAVVCTLAHTDMIQCKLQEENKKILEVCPKYQMNLVVWLIIDMLILNESDVPKFELGPLQPKRVSSH